MKRPLLLFALAIALVLCHSLSQYTVASAANQCSYIIASGTVPANQYGNPEYVAAFSVAPGDGVHVIATNSYRTHQAKITIEISHYPYPTGLYVDYAYGIPTAEDTQHNFFSSSYRNVYVQVGGEVPVGERGTVSYTVHKLSDCYSVTP